MRRIAALAAVVAALAFPAHAEVSKRDVDVKMADGAKLRATIYSQGRRVPGLLLLHQCNSDRRSWDALATSLAKAGLSVMTMDFRGYGESAGAGTPREKMADLRAKWPSDVETAWAFFTSQPDVDGAQVGAGGASCGAAQALLLASKHPEIQVLVLLSGGVPPERTEFLAKAPGLAVFAAASEDDRYPAAGMRRAVETSPNHASRLVMLENAGHGVPMFDKDKTLLPAIVRWVKATLDPP